MATALVVTSDRGQMAGAQSPSRLRALRKRFGGDYTPPLCRAAPGNLVTLAGAQGGGGVSSTALLLATAVAQASDKPSLVLESGSPTSGGLAALAGVCSQASPETTALMLYEGTPLAQPYASTDAGVHLIAGPPDSGTVTTTVAAGLLDEVLKGVVAGYDDAALASVCRAAVAERRIEQLTGARDGPGAEALSKFIVSAREPHSLVAMDLGTADAEALRRYGRAADLHVWVIAAREHNAGYLRAKLEAQPAVASREAIVAWVPPTHTVPRRALRQLSEARGCPVVRLPTYAHSESWVERAERSEGSLEFLCSLLP